MSSPVRVRFAPSPTGYLHIGGLRTALYNWFFARKHGGTFLLRIEDTDRTRLVDDATEKLVRALSGCGISIDEGVMLDEEGTLVERGVYAPYIQSKRRETHLAYAYELIARDAAYYCFCTPEELDARRAVQGGRLEAHMYDRQCRSLKKEVAENRAAVGDACVIRLKVPLEGTCAFHDLIRGRIEVAWAQVDDQVLVKTDGFPTYHLAAMCDDHDMKISHVIRAEEWISSTPKHVFLFQAMGWDVPAFAHVPLLLNADRSKLSKRQGDVAVEDYLAKGYLPEALLNFVALLGWNPTSDREIFSQDELASLFEIEKVNSAGAVLNIEKLDWLNAHYLRAMPEEVYLALATPVLHEAFSSIDEALLHRAALLFRDRVSRIPLLVEELRPWLEMPQSDATLLVWKTQSRTDAHERLIAVRTLLASFDAASLQELETRIKAWILERGWKNGEVLWPLRVALSGAAQSPSPFELWYLLGKEEGLRRLDGAITSLVE